MADNDKKRVSVFSGVLDAINANRRKKSTINPQSPGMGFTQTMPALDPRNGVEQMQQQYLDWQVTKISHDLYTRTVYYDTDRISAYQDFRAMDGTPEIAAALNIIRDECVDYETVIQLADNQKKTIEELCEQEYKNFYVYSYNPIEKCIEMGKCERVVYKGEQDVYKIIFSDDSFIKATSEHLWLVENEYKYLKTSELKEGVAVQSTNKDYKIKSVEFFGKSRVYDLVNVENQNNFVVLTSNETGVVSHNCLTRSEKGNILEVYSEDKRIKQVLQDLFKNVLNVDFNMRLWIRDLVKYGDYFVLLQVDKEVGIYDFLTLPMEEVHREEGYDGRTSSVRFRWETTGDYFEEWQIAHFRLLEDSRKLPYGRCLKSDTYIETKDGVKFIKDIQKGDIVFSFDTKTQQKVESSVLDVVCSGKKDIYKIRTKNNEIETSIEHKFLVFENQEFIYKGVDELKMNDLLVVETENGFAYSPIISIENTFEKADTYDIYVDNDNHNFYANGIIVHNSLLDSSRKLWKQLQLAEDAMLVYRLVRAPERRIFFIEVGNLPDDDVKQYVQKIQNQIRKQPMVDVKTGNVAQKYNPENVTEDYWIPIRGDKSSKVETLPGACLALDTKIDLLDGRSLELKDIIKEYEDGKKLWTYSINPQTGQIVPSPISWAGVTRRNTDVVKITLDNGEIITCTPDHKFDVRGVGIKQAKDLLTNESLWSFNKKIDESLEMIYYDHKAGEWQHTKEMVKNYFTGKSDTSENSKTKEVEFFNHKIVSVEFLSEKQDTGTITVDGEEKYHNYHNFALSCGVFTKNSNLADIQDIEYLQNKLFAALQVPKTYLNYSESMPGGSTLSQADIRFSRTVNSIQEAILLELRRVANVHLYFLGFEDDLENFQLTLTNPSTQQELLKLETMKARLEVFKECFTTEATAPTSYTWAMENVLGFSKSDIKLMLKQKKVEKKIFAEIDSAIETYKKIGLFDELDDRYEDAEAAAAVAAGGGAGAGAEGGDEPGGAGGGGGGGSILGGLGGGMDMGAAPPEAGGAEAGGAEAGGAETGGAEEPAAPLTESKLTKRLKQSDNRMKHFVNELLGPDENIIKLMQEKAKQEDNVLVKKNKSMNMITKSLLESMEKSINSVDVPDDKNILNEEKEVQPSESDSNVLFDKNNENNEKMKQAFEALDKITYPQEDNNG